VTISEGNSLARRLLLALAAIAVLAVLPMPASAFPDVEVDFSEGGGPPFSFGITSTASGCLLLSDRRLVVSYGEVLKLFDMGTFAAETTQPPALSVDDGDAGIIMGIAGSSNSTQLFASQDSGNLLIFSLEDVASKPQVIKVAEADKLGPLVIDSNGQNVYIADNTAHAVQVVDLATGTVSATIPLAITTATTFTVTDGVFVRTTHEAYFTTDSGALFVIPSGGSTATLIDIGATTTPRLSLSAIAAMPMGEAVWVVDATTPAIVKVPTSTHVPGTPIPLSANAALSDIAIAQVTNPSAFYAYVAGEHGVSVIDTASGQVFNFGDDPGVLSPITTSAQAKLLAASTSTDGMVYMLFTTGSLGVLSDRPFAAVTSLTYSSGGTTLRRHESILLEFLANDDVTYELRSGGGVDADGTLLVDESGATSGEATAGETVSVTIPYDANSAAFLEGANDLWIFVDASSFRGRRATSVTVDTPPPDVVARSTGVGNEKVYVNFDRLTVNDMASYNIYVDTDAAAVLTKTEVAASVAQPSSGSEVTGEAGGLQNGTTYFIAVEAVDAAGNKSDHRTSTLPDGAALAATPVMTGGPAAFSGEKGCALAQGGGGNAFLALGFVVPLAILLSVRRSRFSLLLLLLAIGVLLAPARAQAAEPAGIEEQAVAATSPSVSDNAPPWWSFEVKTGFWMPQSSAVKQFFSPCCNLVTRIQGGLLVHRRYGVELGTGFLYKSGKALTVTGEVSQDSFTFLLFPVELSFAWRADYFSWRYLVPYAKAGVDGWVFYESTAGQTIKGIKYGLHAVGGVQINLGLLGDAVKEFESSGIKDCFLTLETQYQWINNFGGHGLDLSGPVFSAGLLFEF
jgi:VCBS repeat-containing protein